MLKILLGLLCVILIIFIIFSLKELFTKGGEKKLAFFQTCLYSVILIIALHYITDAAENNETAVEEAEEVASNSSANSSEEESAQTNEESNGQPEEADADEQPAEPKREEVEEEDDNSTSNGKIVLDPPTFKEKFNQLIEDTALGDDGHYIEEFQIKEGPINYGAYYKLTPGVELMFSLDKKDHTIKEIMVICIEDGSIDTGPYNLAALETIIHIVDPALTTREERLDILAELELLSGMSAVLNNDGKTLFATKNDYMYSVEYNSVGEFVSRYVFWVDIS